MKGQPLPALDPDGMTSIVYFIHDPETGLTKIGKTRKNFLAERIRTHERTLGYPLTLLGAMPGDYDVERAIHQRLRETRVRPEWFRSSDELAAIVLALPIAATDVPMRNGWGTPL